ETLKNKWKNLRDSYHKYLKANSTTTGQAAGASKGKHLDPYKNWIWAKHLEFLRPHLKFAATLSNVLPVESTSNELNISHDNDTSNDEQVDVENIEESQLSDPPPVSVSKINEREKNKKLPAAASNIDKVLEHLNKKQKITHTALDPVEMLMLSYAKTIKTFSPIRQAIAKKKISEIISDLEIEEIAENEQNKRYY
ncbi:transcription factor Adf-1-like, partial [Aphis craccivora]